MYRVHPKALKRTINMYSKIFFEYCNFFTILVDKTNIMIYIIWYKVIKNLKSFSEVIKWKLELN